MNVALATRCLLLHPPWCSIDLTGHSTANLRYVYRDLTFRPRPATQPATSPLRFALRTVL